MAKQKMVRKIPIDGCVKPHSPADIIQNPNAQVLSLATLPAPPAADGHAVKVDWVSYDNDFLLLS